MIYMLWKECIPIKFYRRICQEKNNLYLNGKKVLQLKVLEIISEFIDANEGNYKIIFLPTKTFSSMFIQMYFQKFIAPTKREVSTLKATSASCLKLVRTKNIWKAQWGKTQLITNL